MRVRRKLAQAAASVGVEVAMENPTKMRAGRPKSPLFPAVSVLRESPKENQGVSPFRHTAYERSSIAFVLGVGTVRPQCASTRTEGGCAERLRPLGRAAERVATLAPPGKEVFDPRDWYRTIYVRAGRGQGVRQVAKSGHSLTFPGRCPSSAAPSKGTTPPGPPCSANCVVPPGRLRWRGRADSSRRRASTAGDGGSSGSPVARVGWQSPGASAARGSWLPV